MAIEPSVVGESEILAAALHTYLSQSRFAFADLTGARATESISIAVAQWAVAAGWKTRWEAPIRYIDPPRAERVGCRICWSPPWSAHLDLRLVRGDGPPIAVEIDRTDDSTAVDKLRDEALRGHPALWIRWHGALRTELPAGVARLHLPARSTRPPARYFLDPVDSEPAVTFGGPVTAEAQEDAQQRDQARIAEERRAAALPRPRGPIW
ncbi:hypothetical protein [Kitasatospora sp. NPDC004272]